MLDTLNSRNREIDKALEIKNIEIDKLKFKINEREGDIGGIKKEYKNMVDESRKRIKSKDELIKMKEAENINLQTKLIEEQLRSSSILKLNSRNKDIHPSPKYFFHFQTDVSEMFDDIFEGPFDKKYTIKMKNIGWKLKK